MSLLEKKADRTYVVIDIFYCVHSYNTSLCFKAFSKSAGYSIYTYIPQNFYHLSDPTFLMYHHDPMSGCPASVMNVTVNNVTQGISFINNRPSGYTSNCPIDEMMYTSIEICKIRIMGQLLSHFSFILSFFSDMFFYIL